MANKVDWILKISSVFGTFPLKYKAKMCQVSIILKVLITEIASFIINVKYY